jgi:hypothetical protein
MNRAIFTTIRQHTAAFCFGKFRDASIPGAAMLQFQELRDRNIDLLK